ncbi:hypothetical protein GCM10027521_05320 [Amycolatopsis cihanbeyliensis]
MSDPDSPYNTAVIIHGPVTVDAVAGDPAAGLRTITCPVCGGGDPIAITQSAHLVCETASCRHRWCDPGIGPAEAGTLHRQVRETDIDRHLRGDFTPLTRDLVITPPAPRTPMTGAWEPRELPMGL